MSKAYELFNPWILSQVPGCPEMAVLQAVRDTVIQFCELSLIHQVDHDPVSVVAGQVDYDIESPLSGTRVVKIMRIWYKNASLSPVAPDGADDPVVYNQQIGGYTAVRGEPTAFIQKDMDTFSLYPVPSESLANSITMRVALAPLRASTGCEDFLFEKWMDAIASGALATLLFMPGRIYSNPQAAQAHHTRFMSKVNEARQLSVRGHNRSSLSVRMRAA